MTQQWNWNCLKIQTSHSQSNEFSSRLEHRAILICNHSKGGENIKKKSTVTQSWQDFSQGFHEHKCKHSTFIPHNLPFKAQEKAAKDKEGHTEDTACSCITAFCSPGSRPAEHSEIQAVKWSLRAGAHRRSRADRGAELSWLHPLDGGAELTERGWDGLAASPRWSSSHLHRAWHPHSSHCLDPSTP